MQLNNLIATRARKKVYRDGDLAIKLFEKGYSKADILNEALNQARVEETTDLLIPKIQGVSVINDEWAIVMDFVEGTTLASIIKDENDPNLEFFVDLHLTVHSKKVPLLNVLKHKITRQLGDCPAIDERARYELLTRLESLPKHYKLCHGDFIPSNIVIAKDQKPYILDWSHATQGNASADVARTYLAMRLQGDLKIAERYLDLYCEKSKTLKSYVQGWMPIVAAAQLSKEIPQEKEFLSSWINIFDYE
ncbi:MAG: aminoglycoside phosphotransferase family protein [Deltaproteobacteria bacterium]|jgi:aminoglycoside phosphotransferase (APT) family kinase protein|nr:aminoglycoside phosphotransferase family protein [Deltaproteobacteria bacterium]